MYGGGFDDGAGGGGQFGGDSQFGGGGGQAFGNSNFGGDAFGGGNMSQGGGFAVDNNGPDAKGKQLNKQSLAPCTIKQLKNAPASGGDNGFSVDGKDLHQVTIVGLITHADEQNTNLQYTVDDGTDSINVKMWIDAATDEAAIEKRAQWREGAVVRVIGQMRAFNQVRSIVAFHIQPLTDFNEYTFHFIEVVHTHLRNTKGSAAEQGGAPAAGAGMAGASMGVAGGMAGGMAPQGGAGFAPQPGFAANSVASTQETVMKYFTSYAETDIGCTITDCVSAMGPQGVTDAQVRTAVENLVNEGHLYSTIDDEHYKATA